MFATGLFNTKIFTSFSCFALYLLCIFPILTTLQSNCFVDFTCSSDFAQSLTRGRFIHSATSLSTSKAGLPLLANGSKPKYAQLKEVINISSNNIANTNGEVKKVQIQNRVQGNKDPRKRIRCLGGVTILCWPVTPTVRP
jgi:hypothetical protein